MTQQIAVHMGTLIEYPEYDRAWIAWITQSSYLIMKIKCIYNKNGEIEIGDLFSKLEVEWILKTEFNYKIINKPNKRKRKIARTNRRKSKQMKLYTEKQVKKVWKAGQKYWETSGVSITLEELLEQEKSIELPSDDKIIYKCFQKDSYELATDGDSVLKIYSDGYKAALEQLLNQNK